MIFNKLLLIFISIFLGQSFNEKSFFEFKFYDLDNKLISFSGQKEFKATVIVFLLSDCPASQSYTLTLNKLSKKFRNDKIQFIGVFPGKFSTDEEMKDFRQLYKISYPLLKDPEMLLAKSLNATIVPSCYVVNDGGNVIYKGRIDDWLYALGKKRQVVTENNLNDALNSIVNNLPVKKSETVPIGCILEYDK